MRLPRFRRPEKVYYGWFIVVAALFAQLTQTAIQSHSQAVFLVPMTEELGWSRADFTWGQTIGTAMMSGAGFMIGSLIDAKGPRRFMLGGAVVLSISVIGLSQVQELWQFLLLRGVGITVGGLMVGNLVVNSTVSKWFVRRRAWAITFATTGLSLSGVFTPRITTFLIGDMGWRDAWVAVGILSLFLTIPAALVMRRRPEDYGLLPDGDEPGAVPPTSSSRRPVVSAANEVQWTRREAIRTRAFWLLVLSFGLASFGSGSFFLHLVSYLQDSGYTATEAASRFSLTLTMTACSRPVWGAIMQRVTPRYCAAISFVTTAICSLGIVLSLRADNDLLLYVALLGWGLGFGGAVPLQELIWATYFGRNHIGQVRSVAVPMMALASALGPQFAARVYDAAGSYGFAFVCFALASTIGALCAITARPPAKTPEPPAVSRPRVEPVEAPI